MLVIRSSEGTGSIHSGLWNARVSNTEGSRGYVDETIAKTEASSESAMLWMSSSGVSVLVTDGDRSGEGAGACGTGSRSLKGLLQEMELQLATNLVAT